MSVTSNSRFASYERITSAAKVRQVLLSTALAGVVSVCAASCAQPDINLVRPSSVQMTTTPTVRWQLTFSMSGGFAGIDRRLELSDGGELTVVDQNTGQRVTTLLPESTMAEIRSWILRVKNTPAKTPLSARCRDCFEYRLEIRRENERVFFRLDDTTLAEAEIAPLVEILARLQTQALAGK